MKSHSCHVSYNWFNVEIFIFTIIFDVKRTLAFLLRPKPGYKKILRNGPEIGQKMGKFKNRHWPAILLPHMKFGKKSYFEWDPESKSGQKWPKNGQKRLCGVQKMPFFKILAQIMKIQIFPVKKRPFVPNLDPNWAKSKFFKNPSPKKDVLHFLWGSVLF